MMKQRTVRIFLSSTFRDFEDERRLLVQEVFPVLRMRLRERLVELVDIDLRWGISAEEAEQGLALPICLDEIDQCRPYFIGLLGERYGWVPPCSGYTTNLAETHPWLVEHRGLASVTELEVRYGVLNNLNMRQRALFFFRDPAYAEQIGGEFLHENEADRIRQGKLKELITNSKLPVFAYKKPHDLVSLLEAQLWKLLDAEFPAESVPNAYDLASLNHSAFVAAKLGPRFVDSPLLHLWLSELTRDDRQRLLVTSPPSMGKSTLLAHWWNTQLPSAGIAFYHSLDAGDSSNRTVDVLRRLLQFIRQETSFDDAVPEDRVGLLKSLPEWLARAHTYALRKKINWIIVIDGLDRLRDERDLLWLPTFIPECIRLIVSCRPGPLQNTLKRRGNWDVLKLQPLQLEEQRAMILGQLVAFKKRLSESQLEAILRHPCADQPLFLCTLAEELRVFGSFEGLQGYLNELLTCTGLDDLYEKILARLEISHDPLCVKKALSAICLSQNGLTEQEVLEYSGLVYQARWSPLRLALGDSLLYVSGRVLPAHSFLRKAVRDRYFHDPESERYQRLELANWFGKRPLDRRSAWEQSAQLAIANAHKELLRQLSDWRFFELVHQMGGNDRLHRYWIDIEVALGVIASEFYEHLWPRWQSEMSLNNRLEVSERLHRFMRYRGEANHFTIQLALDRLLDCKLSFGESDFRYIYQMGACAQTLSVHQDRISQARYLAEQACIAVENIEEANAEHLACQLLIFARICLKQRDIKLGITAVERSLHLLETSQGAEHPSLIPHLNCLTDLLLVNAGKAFKGEDGRLKGGSQLGRGIDLQSRCLRILRHTKGLNHLDSAACMIRTGHVFQRSGQISKAIKAYESAITIRVRLLGKTHSLTQSARRILDLARESIS